MRERNLFTLLDYQNYELSYDQRITNLQVLGDKIVKAYFIDLELDLIRQSLAKTAYISTSLLAEPRNWLSSLIRGQAEPVPVQSAWMTLLDDDLLPTNYTARYDFKDGVFSYCGDGPQPVCNNSFWYPSILSSGIILPANHQL